MALGSSYPLVAIVFCVSQIYPAIEITDSSLTSLMGVTACYSLFSQYALQPLKYLFVKTVRIDSERRTFSRVTTWWTEHQGLDRPSLIECRDTEPTNMMSGQARWHVPVPRHLETIEDTDVEMETEDESDHNESKLLAASRASRESRSRKLDYQVATTSYWFFHNFWPFLLERSIAKGREMHGMPVVESLYISTIGFTTGPLMTLLGDITKSDPIQKAAKVGVYRANSWQNDAHWNRARDRDSRPMDTIVMDPSLKQKILEDMNDYLLPQTRKWYSARGIPLRRGLLLYGQPGTVSHLSSAIDTLERSADEDAG